MIDSHLTILTCAPRAVYGIRYTAYGSTQAVPLSRKRSVAQPRRLRVGTA